MYVPAKSSAIDYRYYLPSDAEIITDERNRQIARKLPWHRLLWLRFLWFWRLGNLSRIRRELDAHDLWQDIERQDRELLKILKPEATMFGNLLIQHLSRLGFSNVERYEGRRRIVGRIRFRQIWVEPRRFYYQVLTSKRTATGARSMLPWHVNASDLLDEKTVTHLSIALNRRVTAEYRPHKGLWYVVHTTEDMAALPQRVSFADMLEHMTPGKHELILGVGANRTVHIVDLDKRPHLLLAGSTGGGKSNTLNAMICMLIRMNTPAQMKLLLIDLKNGVEFEDYEDIPHLVTEVVTTQRDARDYLARALALITIRYSQMRTLSKPRPKSLTAYNARVDPAKAMPRLIIIVDELAELLIGGDYKLQQEIENLLIRIAQLGRAAGVHLLLSTQRPQKEIVSTAISAQMSIRMSHIMGTNADSMTVFGSGDAAQLDPVPGRAVYRYGWEPHQVQPPYVTPEIIGGSTAIAKTMKPHDLRLPDLDVADQMISSGAAKTPDIESELIQMLEAAGGNLSLELIMNILGKTRPDAQLWQQRVADFEFEYQGKMYRTTRRGRSYAIVPVNGHNQDAQVEVAKEVAKPVRSEPQPFKMRWARRG